MNQELMAKKGIMTHATDEEWSVTFRVGEKPNCPRCEGLKGNVVKTGYQTIVQMRLGGIQYIPSHERRYQCPVCFLVLTEK